MSLASQKPVSDTCSPAEQESITRCCRWLESEEPVPALEELARRLNLSPWQLHRSFKRATGLTPKAYAKARRGHALRAALAPAQSLSVTDAAYLSGYEASSSFYKDAPAMLGMAPQAYRNRGRHQSIRFALAECSLGSLLVASTERGVCCVLLGDDAQALVEDLQQRFAAAELIGADAGYEQTVARVVALIEQPRLGLALPLDIQGTAFQQRVWQALQSIPAGQTVSYSQLAQSLGMPQAARAVASAVAANPIAVAVPCHRVLRNDGSISGYRWGVERKRALLLREAQQAAKA
ncbi:MAG: bifunctional DNA-binding transcriptional regulator/O6-methylguanine-DNA methyltransferase Ada [Comamonas sp.]|jgi:AraC family transcriptional regulator of adaptative response/methylated-DNA-[protein]-cysteine methyltransferase|nr:bifunctional DNA-binding transcriptional regulator/O6-methylguanine-DNA methyltransferase Ada [Comamonas sp.]